MSKQRPPLVSDERLSHALTAFLRQEVQAPAIAVNDLLSMIIEEACGSQSEDVLADLKRMYSASAQLNAFVKTLIQIHRLIAGKTKVSKPSTVGSVTICERRLMP